MPALTVPPPSSPPYCRSHPDRHRPSHPAAAPHPFILPYYCRLHPFILPYYCRLHPFILNIVEG